MFYFQLIVATHVQEIYSLDNLYKKGKENGVKDLKILNGSGIKEIEPNCVVRFSHRYGDSLKITDLRSIANKNLMCKRQLVFICLFFYLNKLYSSWSIQRENINI